ncbi:MAG TPA: response regulator, partial [Pseudomonadales bacterium]|nr:response regulator [Pseudomonadales bacterium]
FQQYEQADSSVSRKYGGTGLGLTISKKLANLMQGDTGVTSEPGVGSCFWFEVIVGLDRNKAHTSHLIRAKTIAIVSDRDKTQAQIEQFFTSMGYRCSWLSAKDLQRCAPSALAHFDDLAFFWDDNNEDLNHLMQLETVKSFHQPVYVCLNTNKKVAYKNCSQIQFPLHKTKWHRLTETSSQTAQASAKPHTSLSCRVLIVEDNPVNQMVLRGLLKRCNSLFSVAENGMEAITALKDGAEKFDLILMDCEMPILDGYETTRQIRAWESANSLPRTPIIALTAHALQDYREKAMNAGMDDYLTKPINPAELERILSLYIYERAA